MTCTCSNWASIIDRAIVWGLSILYQLDHRAMGFWQAIHAFRFYTNWWRMMDIQSEFKNIFLFGSEQGRNRGGTDFQAQRFSPLSEIPDDLWQVNSTIKPSLSKQAIILIHTQSAQVGNNLLSKLVWIY